MCEDMCGCVWVCAFTDLIQKKRLPFNTLSLTVKQRALIVTQKALAYTTLPSTYKIVVSYSPGTSECEK